MQPHLQAAQSAIHQAQQADATQSLRKLKVPYDTLADPSSGLRVNKWDALILDSEILGLLKTPVKDMFSMFEPGVMDRVKPEIDALLGALLFCFSTGVRRVRLLCWGLLNVRNADGPIVYVIVANARHAAGECAVRSSPADKQAHCCALHALSGSAVRLEAVLPVSFVVALDVPSNNRR